MNNSQEKLAELGQNDMKKPAFLQVLVELMTRFELVTSSLPRMRSTD